MDNTPLTTAQWAAILQNYQAVMSGQPLTRMQIPYSAAKLLGLGRGLQSGPGRQPPRIGDRPGHLYLAGDKRLRTEHHHNHYNNHHHDNDHDHHDFHHDNSVIPDLYLNPEIFRPSFPRKNTMHPHYERLTEIGYLLERAGSDDAVICLSRRDAELLELFGTKQKVEVTREEVVADEITHQPLRRQAKVMIPVCGPVVDPTLGGRPAKSFEVHVGTARAALELLLEGKPLEGRRMPDAVETN